LLIYFTTEYVESWDDIIKMDLQVRGYEDMGSIACGWG